MECLIVFILLSKFIGVFTTVMSFVVLVLFIPLPLLFSYLFSRYRPGVMECTDHRVHAFQQFLNGYSSMKLHNLRVGDGEVDRQGSETTQRSCPKIASICLYVSTKNRTRREYHHVQCSLLLDRSISLLVILGHRCPGRKARRYLWTSGIRQIITACSASRWNVSDEWRNGCREHHSFLLCFSITVDLHRHDSGKYSSW